MVARLDRAAVFRDLMVVPLLTALPRFMACPQGPLRAEWPARHVSPPAPHRFQLADSGRPARSTPVRAPHTRDRWDLGCPTTRRTAEIATGVATAGITIGIIAAIISMPGAASPFGRDGDTHIYPAT